VAPTPSRRRHASVSSSTRLSSTRHGSRLADPQQTQEPAGDGARVPVSWPCARTRTAGHRPPTRPRREGDAAGLGADHDVRTQPIGERRARDGEGGEQLRNQWPILAAGALSTISGVGFAAVAVADDTVHLGMLALYAATGGVFFVIQAGLLPPFPPAAESAASVPA
jgi:hypothetical protein